MPTAELDSRTHNRLPDIFRTINGINLDIGPFDRLRDSEETTDGASWGRGEKGATGRSHFPRIILRDALGYELDTFTTLQEAIYRAKWNVKQSGYAKEPLEWRLPKAPAPARPDLTRTFPAVKHPPVRPSDSKFKGKFESTRVLEFDVDDVGFVRESLQYLPYAPSLSFLRQELLVGPKTYFQIVGTLLLHKKFLSHTEKRNAVYNFPGFCSGCMRMGLCYGCSRSTEIHFHEDKPVKTGGGFTYFKKDRPENEIKSRNPINWKIQHPDQALKKLMEEYTGVQLEGPIHEEIKKHLDKHGGHREKIVSHIPDFAREMQEMNDREKLLLQGNGHLPDINARYGEDDENEGDLVSEGEGHSGRGHDLDPKDVKVHIQGQGEIDEEDGSDGYQEQQGYRDGWEKEHPSHIAIPKSDATGWNKTPAGMLDDTLKSGYITDDDESNREGRYDRQGHRLPKYRRVESGSEEENDEGEQTDTETGSARRSRRKERLYTAPPPFKLRKSPKRSIASKSPFSTDRVYDLPKGKAFELKKSDKSPTQFKEFRNVDVSWKEPKKFELKKNDHKSTKFWSGPPKTKEKKKGGKSHGLRRVPSPRSVSPDSGLDSEFLTAAIRGQQPAQKFKTSNTIVNREDPLLDEDKDELGDYILVPTDGDELDQSQTFSMNSNENRRRVRKVSQSHQRLRKKMVRNSIQTEGDDKAVPVAEKTNSQTHEDRKAKNVDTVINKETHLEKGTDEDDRAKEAESDMVPMSELIADLNEDIDGGETVPGEKNNQSRLHKHGRRRKKQSIGDGKKEKERRSSGEPSFDESDNQSDEYSNKLASQSSRYRSRSHQIKSAGTSQVSVESKSDDLSYYSTNQSSLDNFHDTATEYYKNFDLEDFQRKQNLRDHFRRSPRKLPSLADGTQARFSVNILNKQRDVKPQARKFSNQGGLSSRPSLKNTNIVSPIPGSPKLGESRLSDRERSGATPQPGLQNKQGLRQTDTRGVSRSASQQKYIVYQPGSSAISPILYQGDKSDTHIEPSDGDVDWNEATEEVKRICEGHMTLSDLESETSVQHRKYGDSNRTARRIYAGTRRFKEGGGVTVGEKGNVSKRNVIFRHFSKDMNGENSRYIGELKRSPAANELIENNTSGEQEEFPSIAVEVKAPNANTLGRNQIQSNRNFQPPKKGSKGQLPSDTQRSRSESNSPRMNSHSNNNNNNNNNMAQSNRSRARSLIMEYQKLYQQQQYQKGGRSSLPALGIETKSDKSEGQRSLSVGNFTPYYGSPDLYDKHARGSSSKTRTSFSRGSKTTQKFSRSESIAEDLEDIWIKDDANERKEGPLKVPTGRRESFFSNAQSQFTGSYVDLTFVADSKENINNSKLNDVQETENDGDSNTGIDTSSPPLIPSDVDREKGSLTSQEPDLELEFDDVIDVENIEVLEEDDYPNEDAEKQKKLERKRRHKHRKHKRRKKDQLKTSENDMDETFDPQNKIGYDDMQEENENVEKNDEIKVYENENDNNVRGNVSEEEILDDAVNTVARENAKDLQDSEVNNKTGKKKKQRKKKLADGDIELDLSQRDASLESSRNTNSRHRKSHQTKSKRHPDVSFDSKYWSGDSYSEEESNNESDGAESKERRHNQSRRKEDDKHKLEDGNNNGIDNFFEEEESFIANSSNKKEIKKRKSKKRQKEVKDLEESNMNEGDLRKEKQESQEQKENEINEIERKQQPEGKKKRSRERNQRKVRFRNPNENGSRQAISRGRKKRREERTDNSSDEEVKFNHLPSIQSQLAKIFNLQSSKIENEDADVNKSNEENHQSETEQEDSEIENTGSEIKMKSHPSKGDRPKSADRNNFLGVSGKSVRKFRSMSLPLLSDMESLQQNMGDITLEQLKAPLRVPIYLPSFPQGRVIVKKDFKANPKRVKGRGKRSMSISVVTLTPQLFQFEAELKKRTQERKDTTNKSELEPVREESRTVTPDMGLSEGAGTPLQLRVQSPVTDKPPRSVSPPKKREIIKKVKKPRSPIPTPVPPPKPPTPVREKTPSPVQEERPVSREISFDFVKEKSIPELPPIELPDLPEIQERQSEYKGIKKERKLIEVTPEVSEAKKKLPPPPKIAPRIKTRTSRKSKVAEAPVTTQELQQLSDPLDFLAKYCIINPDRLPYYERVFNGAVNIQTPRYTRDAMPGHGGMVHLPPAQLSEHELNMLRDMTVITHAQTPRREGISMPEQYLEKLNYSIEFIKSKQEAIVEHMQALQAEKIHLMAQMAKQLDRDIVRVDYKTKGGKKKKKKKKKKKSEEPDYDTVGAMSVPKDFRPQRASDITDEVIVSRMDDKMMKKVKKDPTVKNYTIQISRDIEKLKNFDQRISQIEDEKDLVGLYCMDYYFNEQNGTAPPYEFRRQQSRLYQKLHPDPDIEMNMDEVETALQQINNKLLSEKEFQYIYFVLDLPKREKINFRLFSIVAALSEKVTQMDPVIRKLINKVDYNALDIKMDKSKELFELIQDEPLMPVGNAPAETLAVELTAGGLTPEHTNYVLSKFNREGRGFVDFLDFVTYIPLFIDIHKRIIKDPFNETLDV